MSTPRHRDYPITPTVRVYYCDCGGELKSTSVALLTMPPKYPHKCAFCGRKYVLDTVSGSEVTPKDWPMAIGAVER